jgi:hypothetical protein
MPSEEAIAKAISFLCGNGPVTDVVRIGLLAALFDSCGCENMEAILNAVEHPCLSKDVGAPGSLMRRANDLGRELARLRDGTT